MFCDHCGSPLHPTSKFCSACGKPVIPLPSLSPTLPRAVQSENRVRRHINRLAILWLANGVLRLMLVLWFFGASRYSMPPVFGPARLWAQPFWHGHAWNSILLILGNRPPCLGLGQVRSPTLGSRYCRERTGPLERVRIRHQPVDAAILGCASPRRRTPAE